MATHDVNVSGIITFSKRLLEGYKFHGWVEYAINRVKNYAGTLYLTAGLTYTRGLEYVETKLGYLSLSSEILAQYNFRNLLASGIQTLYGIASRAGGLILSRTQSGISDLTGTIARKINVTHSYDGVLNFVGDALSGILPSYSGTLELSGTQTYLAQFYRSVSGILTSTGELFLTSQIYEFFKDGIFEAHGRITNIDIQKFGRLSPANIPYVGTLIRTLIQARRSYAGTLTLSGIVSRLFLWPIAKAGALTLVGLASGTTGGIWVYPSGGLISSSNILTWVVFAFKQQPGVLLLSGAISRLVDLAKSASGAISFAGDSMSVFFGGDWRRGFMNLAGSPTRYLVMGRIRDGNVLAIAGTVTRHGNVERILVSGTLGMSGSIPYKFKDILYFGPPNP